MMKPRILYYLIILLLAVSCTNYEKDDTTPLPVRYLKVPMGKTIFVEFAGSIVFDATQAGITKYHWKTNTWPVTESDSAITVANDTGIYTVIFNNGQDSSKIIILIDSKCFVPTSFSPDNTGPEQNNLWMPIVYYVTSLNLKVFSKDNLLLYQSSDRYNYGWDGKYKGRLCPPGYYYYYLKYTSLIGNDYYKTGYFQLLQ
jgi:hypothetical protein